MTLTSLALTFFLGAQGADIGSTCAALKAGYVEANPLMPSRCSAQVLTKGAVSAAVLFGAASLHRQHPKVARVLLLGAASVSAYAAVRNVRLVR